MQFYRVSPKPRMSESADGRYTWRLPAVRCDACGKLVGSNVGYPNLSIEGKLDQKAYELRTPVTWAEFETLREPLALAAPDRSLFPGMGFGPFRGTVKHSEKRDFIWVWLQELLPSESTWEALIKKGLNLCTGPAVMQDRRTGKLRQDYRRIFDVKVIKCLREQLGNGTSCPRCSKCGAWLGDRRPELVLRKSAIPVGTMLFVPQEVPGFITASEEFAEPVRQAQLNNIAFESVAVE